MVEESRTAIPWANFLPQVMAAMLRRHNGKPRAGYTKNKGQPRNKRRAQMVRLSRRRNR